MTHNINMTVVCKTLSEGVLLMKKLKNEIRYFIRNKELFLLSLPGVILVLIFCYLPMPGLIIAFKNFNYTKGLWGSDWVGFNNFAFFFTSQDAFRVTRNTILLNFCFIITGLIVSVAIALALFELSGRAVKTYQTVLFFPTFISWVIVGYMSYLLFNSDLGVLNSLLTSFGMKSVQWYTEVKYWPGILIIASLWKGVGYSSLIFYTGLMGIDSSFYEAAAIDGASKFQQIAKISIPSLIPLIIMLTLLSIGRIFYADFGLFYFLPRDSGALYPVTDVIDTYVYRALRKIGDIGMASAVGLFQSLVGFILVLATNAVIKKINEESAQF